MQQFDELSHITLGDAFKSLIKFTFTTGLELREVELNDVEVGRSEKCWNGHVDMIGGGEDSTMPLHLQKRAISRTVANLSSTPRRLPDLPICQIINSIFFIRVRVYQEKEQDHHVMAFH